MTLEVSWTAILILVYFISCLNGNTIPDVTGSEHLIYRSLNITSGFNSISRPVRRASEKVQLKFGITLNQILDLDAKQQVLSSYVWIHQMWYDENLKWAPEDFQGINKIIFSAQLIWLPDIYIFNVAGSTFDGFVNVTGTNVLVRSDGHVSWSVPLHINSTCPIDATFFPYDKQSCDIHFGSWVYDITQIDISLSSNKPDLKNYVMNNQFDIDSVRLTRDVSDRCCPGVGAHPMVHLNIRLKRKTNYYDYIVIAPTINLCVLTLATFLLPCECGWKIAIGLTVFLTLYVLQLLIAENVPDTSSTPLISVFLLLVMSLNCISLITATVIMNIKGLSYLEPPPEVPKRLLNLCENYISKIICTRLSDWKRMASNPEDTLIASDSNSKRVQVLSTVDSFKNLGELNHEHAQYVQLKEYDSSKASCSSIHKKRCPHGNHVIGRTTTAESSFSVASANETFISEISYTDQLLTPGSSKTPVINKMENVNHCFQYDDIDSRDICSSRNYYDRTAETSFVSNQARRFSRNRPSYHRAINLGQFSDSGNKSVDSNEASENQSIIACISRKYQWYFVADVLDTIAFFVYFIVMFVAIFTVLVITPMFA